MTRQTSRETQRGLRIMVCAALGLAGSAAMAQTTFADQKDRLVAAIEAAGCIVHEGNHEAILVEADLTPDQGSVIVMQMMEVGEAVPQGDDLRLRTGECK